MIQSFEKWTENSQLYKPVVICGDFNMNMISDSTYSRRSKQICEDYSLELLTNSPTRVAKHSATMIDLCYSNINTNNISCKISNDNQISEHAIMEIILSGKCESLPVKTRSICVWKEYSESQLWQSLENKLDSWNIVENSSVNDKMMWLLDTISSSKNQFKSIKLIKTHDDFFYQELAVRKMSYIKLPKVRQNQLNQR